MLHVLKHPLIDHKLAIMRNKTTSTKDFKENLDEIAGLMVYEISKELPVKEVEVETPICKTVCRQLAKDVVLIPILRAGLGMVDGIKKLIPTAKIGHIGMFRDEETMIPHEYYAKFPKEMPEACTFVLDPMLATGGSAAAALTNIKARGAKNVKLICLVGAMEGVKTVEAAHPDVDIYLAALDDGLTEKCYITPGLGDAGDRLFGTK